jgi:hypothetical protein
METRTRVLAVPAALVLGAVAFAAVLTPCTAHLSANPGQSGPGVGAQKRPARTPCSSVRRS